MAPLRAIEVAYNRGILSGQRVLACVFEELQRRGVADAPRFRSLVDEITSYRQFYDAASDEENALVNETRAVEEAELERQAGLNQSQQVVEERTAVTQNIPLLQLHNDDSCTTEASLFATESSSSTNFSEFNITRNNATPSIVGNNGQPINKDDVDRHATEGNNFSPVNEAIIENQLGDAAIDIWLKHFTESDSDVPTGGGRPRNTSRNESFGDVQPPGNQIIITQDTGRYFKRFKLRGREISLRIRQPPSGTSVIVWLEEAFRDLLTHLTRFCEGSDYAGISFTANSLAYGPVWLSFRPLRDYTFQDVWQLISSVAQSTASLDINDSFNIKTCIVKGVEGKGRKGLTHEGVTKKFILTIRNTDNLCLPRSLVAAWAYAERGEIRTETLHSRWQFIRQTNGSLQREAALELTRNANVDVPHTGCSMRELALYQDYLAREGIAIVVFEFLTSGRHEMPLFDGTQRVIDTAGSVQHILYILYYERSHHFQPISNLQGAVGRYNFCTACNVRYRRDNHRCLKKKCPRCLQTPPCKKLSVGTIRCVNCNRNFFGEECLLNHKVVTTRRKRRVNTVCESLKRCLNCFRSMKPLEKKHICGAAFCKTCNSYQQYNHLCFMSPLRAGATTKWIPLPLLISQISV